MAKVLISIDDAILRRLDEQAHSEGLSRSAFVSRMAVRELGDAVGPGARPEVRAALSDLQELFRSARYADQRDATTLIREERDSR